MLSGNCQQQTKHIVPLNLGATPDSMKAPSLESQKIKQMRCKFQAAWIPVRSFFCCFTVD